MRRERLGLRLGGRPLTLALTTTALMLATVACSATPSAPDTGFAGLSTQDTRFAPLSPALQTSGPSATAAGVQAAVAAPFSDPALGGSLAAVIQDGATGEVLYSNNAEIAATPASTLKIMTAITATTLMGPQSTLSTRVMADDAGAVVLVGGGDPYLEVDSVAGSASLTQLADDTARWLQGKGRAAVAVRVDDSLFTGPVTAPDWAPALLSECIVTPIMSLSVATNRAPGPGPSCQPVADPALAAGEQFAGLLQSRGLVVTEPVTRSVGAPAAATIASVSSLPISASIERMMIESDNVAAEMLGHLSGLIATGEASFASGAAATRTVMAGEGVSLTGATLTDASGLSRSNAIATAATARALLIAGSTPANTIWPTTTGLPVAGYQGTLAARFQLPPANAGKAVVRAKTGTLTGVTALAGQVTTSSGQLLQFAFITNAATDTLAARAAFDNAAAALATCGCTESAVPVAPAGPP